MPSEPSPGPASPGERTASPPPMDIPVGHRFNLCLVSDDFLPAITGVGSHVQCLAQTLLDRGHRLTLLTTRRHGQAAVEEWQGATVHRVFSVNIMGYYQGLPSVSRVRRLLEREGVELIHYHYLSPMLLRLQGIGHRLGLPQVYTYHMPVDVLVQHWPMSLLRGLFSRLILRACNRSDLLISPSGRLAEQLRREGVHPPIHVISNPVRFAQADTTAAAVPLPRPFMLLFAGRLEPEKNIPYLLEGLRIAIQRGLDAGLWIAGMGSQRERLEALCQRLAVRERVYFLGHLDPPALARHYRACDVFVLPSRVETQGLVVMEAMHFGRPVIVTRDIVAAEELVEPGDNGYIVDPTRPEELATHLLALAADPQLRQRLGEAGQRRARSYAPDGVARQTEAAYAEALRLVGARRGR